MVPTDVQPVGRRMRPWIKTMAIVVLPMLMVFCGLAVWDYIETRQLTREIAAIRAQGDPVTIGPLAGRSYNKTENAEYRYSAAALLSLMNEVGDPTVEGRSAMATYARFTPVRTWLSGSGPRPAKSDVAEAMKTLMAEWQDALSLVDKGAGLPYYGVLGGVEFNYRVAGLWNLTRLLSARTIGLSLAGSGDAAVDSAISAIRLRRAIRPSQRWLPTTHEVPAVLSVSKPSEAALRRLQMALASEEDADGPTQDFVDTRARLLNDAWLRYYHVSPGSPLPPPFPMELLPLPQMRPRITHELVRTLRAWSELLEIARRPWPERARLAAEPIARHADEKFTPGRVNGVAIAVGVFTQTVRPDLLVQDRASRIAVAVERYRRSHDDMLPATLADLVPQYLESIPEDPLTGEPLRYRVTPDVYRVYSVGPDGKDDGGALLTQTPSSPTVRFPPGADLGIQVLLKQ